MSIIKLLYLRHGSDVSVDHLRMEISETDQLTQSHYS